METPTIISYYDKTWESKIETGGTGWCHGQHTGKIPTLILCGTELLWESSSGFQGMLTTDNPLSQGISIQIRNHKKNKKISRKKKIKDGKVKEIYYRSVSFLFLDIGLS